MPFPKFTKEHKEPIFCWLYGVAQGGKTTLALDFIRENQPGVVIPMDQRFEVYRDLALSENVQAWPVSDPSDPTIWASADHALEHLRKNFPGSGARSIVWDSISPEFRHWVEWAMTYSDLSPNDRAAILGAKYRNKSALFQPKAHYMEQVGTIANFGAACMWISHEHKGGDEKGNLVMKTSITDQERLKFQRNVNLVLKITAKGNKYGVEVEEARNRPGLNGTVLWDEPGNMFRGMWKKIAAAFYAAEVVEWAKIEAFTSDRQAADLAMEQTREINGEIIAPFKNVIHAGNALEQVKTKAGSDPKALAKAWKAEVSTRLQAAVDDYLASLKEEQSKTNGNGAGHANGSGRRSFKTLEDLLHQLYQDFKLSEADAKTKLKECGFTGFTVGKSGAMYEAVKAKIEAEKADSEIPF